MLVDTINLLPRSTVTPGSAVFENTLSHLPSTWSSCHYWSPESNAIDAYLGTPQSVSLVLNLMVPLNPSVHLEPNLSTIPSCP